MDEFTFRKFRQTDSLRYSKDDVKRKEKELHKNNQPTPRVVYVSRPFTTKDLQISPRESDFNDPLRLKAEYFQIKSEINQLNQEIEPLHRKFQILLNQQQDQEVRTLVYRKKNLTEINVYDRPTRYHVTAQEFVQIKKESDELKDQISSYRMNYSNTTIERLKKEVKLSRQEVIFMSSEIEDMKAEEESVKLEIMNYKLTSEYDKHNKQRKQLTKLTETIKNEMSIHHDLKETYYGLVEENNLPPAEKEKLVIKRLQDDLIERQLMLSHAKERYIKMRKAQIKECKQVEKIIELNQQQSKTATSSTTVLESITSLNEAILWAGYWKKSVRKDDIVQVFQDFGILKSVTINSIQSNDSVFCEAVIHYSSLESSLESVQQRFKGTGLKITEYDKRPPPPKSPSKPKKKPDVVGTIMEVVTVEPENPDKPFESSGNLPPELRIPENINAPMPKYKNEVNIEDLLNSTSASQTIIKDKDMSSSSSSSLQEEQNGQAVPIENGDDVFHSFFTEIGSTIDDAANPVKRVMLKQKQMNKKKDTESDNLLFSDQKDEAFANSAGFGDKSNKKISFDSNSYLSSPVHAKVANKDNKISSFSPPKSPKATDSSLSVIIHQQINQLLAPSSQKKSFSSSSTPNKLENENLILKVKKDNQNKTERNKEMTSLQNKLEETQKAQKIEKQKEIEKAKEIEKQKEIEKAKELEKQKEIEKAKELEKQKEIEKAKEIEKQKEIEKAKEIEKQKEIEKAKELEKQKEIEKAKEIERQKENEQKEIEKHIQSTKQLPNKINDKNENLSSNGSNDSSSVSFGKSGSEKTKENLPQKLESPKRQIPLYQKKKNESPNSNLKISKISNDITIDLSSGSPRKIYSPKRLEISENSSFFQSSSLFDDNEKQPPENNHDKPKNTQTENISQIPKEETKEVKKETNANKENSADIFEEEEEEPADEPNKKEIETKISKEEEKIEDLQSKEQIKEENNQTNEIIKNDTSKTEEVEKHDNPIENTDNKKQISNAEINDEAAEKLEIKDQTKNDKNNDANIVKVENLKEEKPENKQLEKVNKKSDFEEEEEDNDDSESENYFQSFSDDEKEKEVNQNSKNEVENLNSQQESSSPKKENAASNDTDKDSNKKVTTNATDINNKSNITSNDSHFNSSALFEDTDSNDSKDNVHVTSSEKNEEQKNISSSTNKSNEIKSDEPTKEKEDKSNNQQAESPANNDDSTKDVSSEKHETLSSASKDNKENDDSNKDSKSSDKETPIIKDNKSEDQQTKQSNIASTDNTEKQISENKNENDDSNKSSDANKISSNQSVESISIESSSKQDNSEASEAKTVYVPLNKVSSTPVEQKWSTTQELTGLVGTPPPQSPTVSIPPNSPKLAQFKSIKSTPNMKLNFLGMPTSNFSGKNAVPFPKFTPIDKLSSPRRNKKSTIISSDEESKSENSQESDEWFKSDGE